MQLVLKLLKGSLQAHIGQDNSQKDEKREEDIPEELNCAI